MYNMRQGANSALLKIHISQQTSRLLIKQQKHFATSLKRRKKPVQICIQKCGILPGSPSFRFDPIQSLEAYHLVQDFRLYVPYA